MLARRLCCVVPAVVWATEYLALRSAMGDMRALRLQGKEGTEEYVLLGCPLDMITAISQAY